MTKFLMSVLILTIIIVFLWTCKCSMEPFENQDDINTRDTRPWFGYEPGYGPGWGRNKCCSEKVPHNMGM